MSRPVSRNSTRVAEPADGVEADLRAGRRRLADDAGDGDAVGSVLADGHRVEPGGDVRTEVDRPADLVHQLRGDGVDRDGAAGAVVLGDHAGAVGRHLGDREAERGAHVDLGEAGEVAAGGLGAALDDVPGHDGAGQRVEVVASPAVVRDRRPDDHRRVGDPAGDHDVGPAVQGLGDAEGAEVRVGGEDVAELELLGPLAQVVALDVRHHDVDALLGRDLAELLRQPGRVEAAGVGDDLDALLLGEGEAVGHLPHERLGVAGRRVLHPVAAEDEHGELGEVVAGQVVEAPASPRASRASPRGGRRSSRSSSRSARHS